MAPARITLRRGSRPPRAACFRDRQKPNGQIIEYVDLETDRQEDYGLNVADNTPLYMWGVWHHWAQHADAAFRADFNASMHAAAENLLGEIGPRGCRLPRPQARTCAGFPVGATSSRAA